MGYVHVGSIRRLTQPTRLQVALEELAEKADKSPVILKVLEKISQ